MRRIAFDLDETLGVPLIDGDAIAGFQLRPGCLELLGRLRPRFTLCLWSVSSRRYLDKALAFGLSGWFAETYSWDELPAAWKDVRRIKADLLIDDSPHHREAAARHGLAGLASPPRLSFATLKGAGSPVERREPIYRQT